MLFEGWRILPSSARARKATVLALCELELWLAGGGREEEGGQGQAGSETSSFSPHPGARCIAL